MITHLPADIELCFGYRNLVKAVGEIHAAFIFHCLWHDLAFQSRVHGKCGIYSAEYIHHFQKRTSEVGGAVKHCLDAGLLIQSGDDLFCPIFHEYNAHLDRSYCPDTTQWTKEFNEMMRKLGARTESVMSKVPRLAWYLANGETITEAAMNRAVVLVHVLDVILHRKAREPEELNVPTLQMAVSIVSKHSNAKIDVVTRRFMSISRPRLNPLFPPTTEEALKGFDDLMVMACPDEGFEAWIKRVSNKSAEEESQVPDAVSRELAEKVLSLTS